MLPGMREPDSARDAVIAAIARLDPTGERTGAELRRAYDQLCDGGRTGRYRLEKLFKTEETHFRTPSRSTSSEFEFADGFKLDYLIAGREVDAKCSASSAWMLPPEAVGELGLVVTARMLVVMAYSRLESARPAVRPPTGRAVATSTPSPNQHG